jgi:hypothetical protein
MSRVVYVHTREELHAALQMTAVSMREEMLRNWKPPKATAEPPPWPFPTGKPPEKQPEPENRPAMRIRWGGPIQERAAWAAAIRAGLSQPSDTQVRSRSAAAKSPLDGLLKVAGNRYTGLGWCDEGAA